MANKPQQNRNRIHWRNGLDSAAESGSGRGSAAVIWLLSQRLIPRSGCEVPPLLKPINRLPRTLREGRRDLERVSLYCRELFFLSFCSALVNSLFLLEILQERDRERVKACNPRCDNLKQGLIQSPFSSIAISSALHFLLYFLQALLS